MMNQYSIIVDGGTKHIGKLDTDDVVSEQMNKLINSKKTVYVNCFNGELCVDSMKFEKGKRIY